MTDVPLCVGVTTAPRSVDYLRGSLSSLLDSIAAAGLALPRVDVYAEPGSCAPESTPGTPADRIRWYQHRHRLGNWFNWRYAADDLLTRYSDAQIYLLVEDDISYATQAIALTCRWTPQLAARGQFGYLSLYASGTHAQRVSRINESLTDNVVTCVDTQVTRLWGACAMAFTRESLRALVAESSSWLGLTNEKNHNYTPATLAEIDGRDIAIHQAAQRLQLRSWFMHPSVVQHVGAVSGVSPGAGLSNSRRATHVLSEIDDAC